MHASGARRSARTRAPTERAELTVTDATARRAAAHLRRFRCSHPAIDLADYLIAASAEEEGIELVTLNVKHFPMFPKLRPPWGSG